MKKKSQPKPNHKDIPYGKGIWNWAKDFDLDLCAKAEFDLDALYDYKDLCLKQPVEKTDLIWFSIAQYRFSMYLHWQIGLLIYVDRHSIDISLPFLSIHIALLKCTKGTNLFNKLKRKK